MSRFTSAVRLAKKQAKQKARRLLGIRRPPLGASVRAQSFEEQIYSAAVRPGDVAYDIGANVGEVSAYLARLVAPTGTVVAFEPVWRTYVELCRSLQNNDYSAAATITLPFGLSDTDGSARIAMPSGDSGLASLRVISAWSELKHQRPIDEFTCHFRRLDTLFEEKNLPAPHFMKIDVEGAELLVLKGGQRMIRATRPLLLLEVFAPWEAAFDYTPWDLISLLGDVGYRFSFACPDGLVEHEPTASKPVPSGFEQGYNLVAWDPAMHADRVASLRTLLPGRERILKMGRPPMPNVVNARRAA